MSRPSVFCGVLTQPAGYVDDTHRHDVSTRSRRARPRGKAWLGPGERERWSAEAGGVLPTSPGGVQLAGLAHHLIDLRDVLLFESDLLPGVLFEPHALVHYEREPVVVLA